MAREQRIQLELQYFAQEEGAAGAQPQEGAATEAQGQPAADLNRMLAEDTGLQSQFDKLVSKALGTARAKWEREQTMTATERMDEELRQREEGLTQREQTLQARELRAHAIGLLGEKGLPAELADCLSLADEAAMQETMGKTEKAFRQAVDRAVAERMRGFAPKTGGSGAVHAAQVRQAMGLRE